MNRQEIEKIIKVNSVKDFKDYKIFMEHVIPIDEALFDKRFTKNKNVERLGVVTSFKSIIILYLDMEDKENVVLFTKTVKFEDSEWIKYQEELKKLEKPKYNCICCGKEIPSIILKDDDVSMSMWNGGSVDKIITGYGSRFDGDIYFFGICDDCIEIEKQKGSIKFWKRYFH